MKIIQKRTFFILTLGCSKNQVDSDSIVQIMQNSNYQVSTKPDQAEVLIVNTCGFIKPAIDESIAEIQLLAKRKKPGQILIAAGCLTQRYRNQIADKVRGIDGIIGTRHWMDILQLLDDIKRSPGTVRYHLPQESLVSRDEKGILRASIQGATAYLKIAEGCRRACAYCAIPLIKGTQISRPIQKIVMEAKLLEQISIQELILIAQDTTDYGSDLKMKDGLATLLRMITEQAPNIPWIRILYAFPGVVTKQLMEVMASKPQVLPYLDIPLQHADPVILKKMRRPSNLESVRKMIADLRNAMPDIALRTTFIVGFPGETKEQFQTLLDFIEEIQFDHLGAFTYFHEEGTYAQRYGDSISEEIKLDRLERLMTLQQDISLKKNQLRVGKTMQVLIEGFNKGISIGRTYRDAPEIDGLVFIEGKAPVGDIITVKITDALAHDLLAVTV
jgi:ribosomal protein S12 methylthiotransferase